MGESRELTSAMAALALIGAFALWLWTAQGLIGISRWLLDRDWVWPALLVLGLTALWLIAGAVMAAWIVYRVAASFVRGVRRG